MPGQLNDLIWLIWYSAVLSNLHIPTPSFQKCTRLNSTNFKDYVCNHSNVPFLLIQVHKKINKFKWSRDIRTQIQQSIFHASCWSRSVLYRYLCINDRGQYCPAASKLSTNCKCSSAREQLLSSPSAAASFSIMSSCCRLALWSILKLKVCMHRSTQEAGERPATTVDHHEVRPALTFLCSEHGYGWHSVVFAVCIAIPPPPTPEIAGLLYVWFVLLSF